MKHLLYIPFLILMSVTYTRLVDNYNSHETISFSRSPASAIAEEKKNNSENASDEDCIDITARFNPHLKTKDCPL